MKTIKEDLFQPLLIFFFAAFSLLSCHDLNLNEEGTFESGGELQMSATAAALPAMPDMTNYRSMTSASLARNLQNSGDYMEKFKYRLKTDYYYHNYERAVREEAIRLNAYFGFQNFDYKQFSHFEVNFVPYTGTPTLLSSISGASDIYSAEQLRILDAYAYEMYKARSTSDTDLFYAYGRNMVQNSQLLSPEQKYVVLAFIETGNEYAKKHFAGQWNGVRIDVGAVLQEATSGCAPVNWKTVWQSGVISAGIGAVRGAYIGAAGGTVALPGFGSVTGWLGGAVFGGAGGFAMGVGGALVQHFVFECLLKTRTTQPDLQCYDIQYFLNHSDCMQEILDHKVWAKISG